MTRRFFTAFHLLGLHLASEFDLPASRLIDFQQIVLIDNNAAGRKSGPFRYFINCFVVMALFFI